VVIEQIIRLVNIAIQVLVYLIIARCLLSFIPHNPYQPIIRFVYDITEPVMRPFRKIIPSAGGIDFSPFVAVLAVEMARYIVIQLLLLFF
jgi:YggT family protein